MWRTGFGSLVFCRYALLPSFVVPLQCSEVERHRPLPYPRLYEQLQLFASQNGAPETEKKLLPEDPL